MIQKGEQSFNDLANELITARVPNAVPQNSAQGDFAYDYPIMDDYMVPDVMRIYTHIPVNLAANALSSNEQLMTEATEFILEHEVSNVSGIVTSYGQIVCVRQYGPPGRAVVDWQSTGVDAKLWLPKFAGSAAIDQEYRIMPQQQIGFQYTNQTANTYSNIQTALIGRLNLPNFHEPYLSDGPPYMYSTIEVQIPANGKQFVNINIDASKDFLLRAISAAGLQADGGLQPGSIMMNIRNHSTGISWVPNAMTGETSVMLENIAYLGMDNVNSFPLGFSPVVMGHRTQYDISLTNLTNGAITIALNFWGNFCYYEKTNFNKDIRYGANGKYFLD